MDPKSRHSWWWSAPLLGLLALLPRPSPSVADSGSRRLGGTVLKHNLDLPYDAAGEGGEEEEDAPEIILFYGQAYEASDVVFALDESGSMQDQGRWQLQTRQVTQSISELSQHSEFGVVYYGSRVSSFRKMPVRADTTSKAAGIAFVRSRRPQGDTCIGEGVVEALKIVRQSTNNHRAVIVTSDGRPDNCATGNRATPAEVKQILQQTLAANPDRSVRVHTIYVGRNSERDAIEFLKELARVHDGTFRLVNK